MAVNQAWLDQTEEPALLPELPIIDPHHHLWQSPPQRPGETYLAPEFLTESMSGHRIVGSVFMECNYNYLKDGPPHLRMLGETRFINPHVEKFSKPGHGVGNAIVAHADLSVGDKVEELLDAHRETAPKRFRGIRQTNSWDAWDGLRYSFLVIPEHRLRDPMYRRGFAKLAKYDLTFDAWVFHPQLHEVAEIAGAFPGTRIIVDHTGGPLGVGPYAGRRKEVFEAWKKSITDLSRCPNVFMKLGGMGMHCIGLEWHKRAKPLSSDEMVAETKDYYHHCIDAFTPARCMFESNFPVDKESLPASVLWNGFKKIAAGCSDSEKHDLFFGTAARVYKLDVPVSA